MPMNSKGLRRKLICILIATSKGNPGPGILHQDSCCSLLDLDGRVLVALGPQGRNVEKKHILEHCIYKQRCLADRFITQYLQRQEWDGQYLYLHLIFLWVPGVVQGVGYSRHSKS